MEIMKYILIGLGGLVGLGSTLGIVFMLFGTIGYKIYRKIRYGISLFD